MRLVTVPVDKLHMPRDNDLHGVQVDLGRAAEVQERVRHVGRVDLAVQETDLNEVVEEVLASLQISLEERGVEIRFGRTLPRIRCDRVRITEVYRNLITNAMKYNDKPQRWVEIGVTDKAPPGVAGPVFFVRDNGIGIDPRFHQDIFRIFRRLHQRDEYEGTGAGLAICRKIVEAHGGAIWVESEPGRGATFYFSLPHPDALGQAASVPEPIRLPDTASADHLQLCLIDTRSRSRKRSCCVELPRGTRRR